MTIRSAEATSPKATSPKAGGIMKSVQNGSVHLKKSVPNGSVHQMEMSVVFATFNGRCAAIQRAPLLCIPDRIGYILSTNEAATPEQVAAAEGCCCPMCIHATFDCDSTVESKACSICSRRCCDICSQVDGSAIICASKTCAIVQKFKKGEIQKQMLSAKLEEVSKYLLCQWLVLQHKKEPALGSLRALYLIDARNAALGAIRVAGQTGTTEQTDRTN